MPQTLDIAALRQRIRRIEKRHPALEGGDGRDEPPWRFGAGAIDGLWAKEGFPAGALHVFGGAGVDDAPSVLAFMLALVARRGRSGSILWCQSWQGRREFGRLYGPGLAGFGLDPGRLVHAATGNGSDLALALDEGARSKALAAVIAEGPALPFLATRRLALATAASATPVLFHDLTRSGRAGAAATLWQIRAAAGPPDPLDPRAPHCRGWRAELIRHRNGPPGLWHLAWNHETLSFDLAPSSGDRAPPAADADAVRFDRAG